jgi:hypothetical protein
MRNNYRTRLWARMLALTLALGLAGAAHADGRPAITVAVQGASDFGS